MFRGFSFHVPYPYQEGQDASSSSADEKKQQEMDVEDDDNKQKDTSVAVGQDSASISDTKDIQNIDDALDKTESPGKDTNAKTSSSNTPEQQSPQNSSPSQRNSRKRPRESMESSDAKTHSPKDAADESSHNDSVTLVSVEPASQDGSGVEFVSSSVPTPQRMIEDLYKILEKEGAEILNCIEFIDDHFQRAFHHESKENDSPDDSAENEEEGEEEELAEPFHFFIIYDPSIHTTPQSFSQQKKRILDHYWKKRKEYSSLISSKEYRAHFRPIEFHFVKRNWVDESLRARDPVDDSSEQNRLLYVWKEPAEEERIKTQQSYYFSKRRLPKRNEPDEENLEEPDQDESTNFVPEGSIDMPFKPQTRQQIQKLKEQGFTDEEIAKMHPVERPHADIENTTPMCRWKNIQLTIGDYNRLEPLEYLNDNILDMALGKLTIPDNCYMFNTFFYQMLERNPERASRGIPRRSVKLFDKEFLFVPINRKLHWSLLVVCLKGVRHYQRKASKKSKRKSSRGIKRKKENATKSEQEGTDSESTAQEDSATKTQQESTLQSGSDLVKSAGSPAADATPTPEASQNNSGNPSMSTSEETAGSNNAQEAPDSSTPVQANVHAEADTIPDPPKNHSPSKMDTSDTDKPETTPQSKAPSDTPTVQTESEQKYEAHPPQTNNPSPSDTTSKTDEAPVPNGDKSTKKPVLLSENQRAIIGCDSLRQTGFLHGAMSKMRKYLSLRWAMEHPEKKDDAEPVEFTSADFKGSYANLPIQNNDCDCGVFVIRYVEEFLKNLPTQIPVFQEDMFTLDSIVEKRKELREYIDTLAKEQGFVPPSKDSTETDITEEATPPETMVDSDSDSDLEIISVIAAPKKRGRAKSSDNSTKTTSSSSSAEQATSAAHGTETDKQSTKTQAEEKNKEEESKEEKPVSKKRKRVSTPAKDSNPSASDEKQPTSERRFKRRRSSVHK